MNKQTAVEWLEHEIRVRYHSGALDLITISELKIHAKEMEKQQIIDAYLTPLSNEYWFQKDEILNQESEKYYNETYGGDK
jgi:hypothetical protein